MDAMLERRDTSPCCSSSRPASRQPAPPVKKASLCSFKGGSGRGGVEDETGAKGLIFRVDTIQHPSADTALVEGGYFEAGLSASGNLYELVKEGDRWVVKQDTMRWIS